MLPGWGNVVDPRRGGQVAAGRWRLRFLLPVRHTWVRGGGGAHCRTTMRWRRQVDRTARAVHCHWG
eukprot:2883530-Rhodomonas_salina.2